MGRHPSKDYEVKINGETVSSKLGGSADARPTEVNSVIRDKLNKVADFKKAPGASQSRIFMDETCRAKSG